MTAAGHNVLAETSAFEKIGAGLNVYESSSPVEGRAKWLDSPDDVIAFVESGEDVSDVIVIARGGTTTFLSMALNAGVRGVITLQGAPESHLGILSREYGIPCLMSVAFDKGVRTSRGEIIPADDVRLRMDVSSRPHGAVSAETGAPVDNAPAATAGPTMSPEQLAQIQLLLTKFKGEVPHGAPGHEVMAARQATPVLELDDESVRRELTVAEANDFLHYLAWNEWDALASRATEGESGLIPRQEYEALGILNCWFKHPEWLKAIQTRVGADGISRIGARARSEIGTKINLLHVWAMASAPSFGRGIALELKLHDFDYRADDIVEALTTVRRVYKGLWGSGPTFTSMRGYRAEVLDRAWIERFQSDRIDLRDETARSAFQRFNGALELLGFLVHFDNRLGLGDSGPYPTDDGGFVIVRDLFIHEPAFPWSDSTEGLPHAVSIAMFFSPGSALHTRVLDLSTMFTEPSNYLPFVTGAAVYARQNHDTPIDQLRRLTLQDMAQLRSEAETKAEKLYKRIAAMSKREKIMGGARVYAAGFVLPFARAAGMYDELVQDHGLNEIHPVVDACYDTIVAGVATEMIPRLFITGSWANDVPDHSRNVALTTPGEYEVLHAIWTRGFANVQQISVSTALPESDVAALVAAAETSGFVKQRSGKVTGASLTPAGRARLVLLAGQTLSSEHLAIVASAYDAFLAPNQEFKALVVSWQTAPNVTATLTALETVHSKVVDVVVQASCAHERFRVYRPRLDRALSAFRKGDTHALARPLSDSYHDIWMELHEDMLKTMGRARSNADGA
jgi:hypothetical protein